MASRFQLLIDTMAAVRLTTSSSVKRLRTSSYTSSGAWVWCTRVSASVHASAARSRSL